MYNSFGTIDGNAVSKLSLVVNLTKHIHVRSQAGRGGSGTEVNQFFPGLMGAVRGFSVKLEKEGRKISAREYLEDALKPEEGMSEAVEQKNAVRMLIRNFFPERDCVTMVRPVSDEKQLMNLSSLPVDTLRPEFRAQIDALRKRILGTVRPKTLYGKALNGAMLASLAAAYVGALNAGGTPTISAAWDRVVDTQCQDAVDGGARTYTMAMEAALAAASNRRAAAAAATAAAVAAAAAAAGGSGSGGDAAPLVRTTRTAAGETYAEEHTIVEEEDMHAAHAEAVQAAMRYFAAAAVQDPDKTPPFEMELRSQVEGAHARLRRANDVASTAFCLELLDKLHGRAAARLAALRRPPRAPATVPAPEEATGLTRATAAAGAGVVTAASAAKEYRAACDDVTATYVEVARGPARHRVLSDYLLNRLSGLLLDAALSADETSSAYAAALTARVGELAAGVAAARAREAAAGEALVSERRSFAATLESASAKAADAAERAKAAADAKAAELDRLQGRFDKLLAAAEADRVRGDEAAAASATALAAARGRVDELLSTRVSALMDMTTLSQRLVEAEAATVDAEKLVGVLKVKLAEEAKSAAVLLERCRGAENETVRLREQTELLYESVRVQKDLLAAKNDEKEECEYQWGVTKARLAATEAERTEVQARLNVVTGVAVALKTVLVKAGKTALKGLTLDRLEQRAYDSLLLAPAASGAAAGGAGT